MIKLGNTNIAPNGYKKVMRGSSLVWGNVKKVSWDNEEYMYVYDNKIKIPSNLLNKLKEKQLLSIKIGDYKELDEQNIKGIVLYGAWYVEIKGTFYQFFGTQNGIKEGTKITVTYK